MLDPTAAQWAITREEPPSPRRPSSTPEQAENLWPAICEQFALRILASAYQMGSHLEAVEADEQDPERLERLYRIDHANTRIRRHAENLQVLLGRRVEDANPQKVALVDVIRAASSAVEHYPRIRVGHVVSLGIVEFAADDVIRVLTELLDNATRFSPPTSSVIVSGYVTEAGGVLLRLEDSGVGVKPDQLGALNAMLAGNASAPAAVNPAAHLGLVVVSHLARAHHLRVNLTNRPSGGTTATVLVPGALLCEMTPAARPGPAPSPPFETQRPVPPDRPSAQDGGRRGVAQAPAADARAQTPTSRLTLVHGQPTGDSRGPAPRQPAASGSGLPRRVRASVRADGPPGGGSRSPGPEAPPPRASSSDRDSWPDETAAFAAGIADAQAPTSTQPQGQLP
ncbi:sensor histidine kinase KdpD [Micromonospora sp. M71_S20]|uniref:sensor histidine kinase n=1 Tax=Micromonospora sp. M71_S20 TaxID=592872 RepID=UPI001315A4D4|nr:ATP-binding protein [Micromonospora sp. M71_S20]